MAYYFPPPPPPRVSNVVAEYWVAEDLPGYKDVHLRNTDQPEDGQIYIMYHGTTYAASKEIYKTGFKQSQDGILGKGIYVTRDVSSAQRYPLGDKRDQVVLQLKVNVGNVMMINYQGHPLQKAWQQAGYDSAWVPAYCGMTEHGMEEDCIWDPYRIKVIETVYISSYLLPQIFEPSLINAMRSLGF